MNLARLQSIAQKTGALILNDEPLAKHLTLGIGGVCRFFIDPRSWSAAEKILNVIEEEGISFRILGFGSNVIADDKALPFGVMSMRKLDGEVIFKENGVTVDADVPLPILAKTAVEKGLGGLEGMGGIPGTVGGAIATNAGAFDCEISSLLESVEIIESGGRRVSHQVSDFGFGYRHSNVADAGVIARCILKLAPGNPVELLNAYENASRSRFSTQPVGKATAGSVFKNPPGDHAGRILEELGFKGKRRGEVGFSELHANFLVNYGAAAYSDAFGLCEEARLAAGERGYELDYELEMWP